MNRRQFLGALTASAFVRVHVESVTPFAELLKSHGDRAYERVKKRIEGQLWLGDVNTSSEAWHETPFISGIIDAVSS